MKRKYQLAAIIGFIAKGVIYVVIGLLTLLAAFNAGGERSGTNQALKFLERQDFGKIFLAALGLGLLAYCYWMFVQAFQDPENRGSSMKAKAQRFGLFTTGMVYIFVALLSFNHLFTRIGSSDGDSNYFNNFDYDKISLLFIIIGIILAIQGVILTVGVFQGQLLNQFKIEQHRGAGTVRAIGKFGFYSRAFIVLIIAYIFLRAGIYSGSHEIKGIQDAFSFLDQSFFGRILMAFTALGFIAYGCFYILLSKYRGFEEG